MEEKKLSILEGNIIYLILGIALLTIGFWAQSHEIYSGLLITEYIIILVPNLIYLKLKKLPLKEVLRLNKITIKQGVMSFLIVIFSYPIAVFLNLVVITIVNTFTEAMPNSVPIPKDLGQYIFSLFIISITPGICEEIMFRGAIMNAYSRLGRRSSIIISGILFGLFHFNLLNLAGPIFLGIIFGIIVYKTNSIYSSIVGHVTNNTIALTIGYVFTKYQGEIDELAQTGTELPELSQMILTLVGIGFIGMFSLAILLILLKKLPKSDITDELISEDYYPVKEERHGALEYMPIVIVVLIFIYVNTISLV